MHVLSVHLQVCAAKQVRVLGHDVSRDVQPGNAQRDDLIGTLNALACMLSGLSHGQAFECGDTQCTTGNENTGGVVAVHGWAPSVTYQLQTYDAQLSCALPCVLRCCLLRLRARPNLAQLPSIPF